MKQIIFNKKDYKSYKDFYHDVCVKLNKDRFIDWDGEYEDLCYDGNLLNEFMWYCSKDNNKYIFIGFDRDKIAQKKNFDDYQYEIVINIFERLEKEHPNNKVEFITDEKI